MPVATVGGVKRVHPGVQAAFELLNVSSAQDLAIIMAHADSQAILPHYVPSRVKAFKKAICGCTAENTPMATRNKVYVESAELVQHDIPLATP